MFTLFFYILSFTCLVGYFKFIKDPKRVEFLQLSASSAILATLGAILTLS